MKPKNLSGFPQRVLPILIILAGVIFISGILVVSSRPTTVSAQQGDLNSAVNKYPSINSTRLDACSLCHTGSIPNLNSYGADYLSNGRNNNAFGAIEGMDSDGDGSTNLVEIQALTFPGNPNDVPAAASTSTPTQTSTNTPSAATNTPTETGTPTLTVTPTESGTPAPTDTPTETPTVGPSPTETNTPTAAPTFAETATPTLAPTVGETAKPTPTECDDDDDDEEDRSGSSVSQNRVSPAGDDECDDDGGGGGGGEDSHGNDQGNSAEPFAWLEAALRDFLATIRIPSL